MKEKSYIIITGVTSFVGISIAKKLVENNYKVIGLSRSLSNAKSIIGGLEIKLFEIDLRNRDELNKLLNEIIREHKNIGGFIHCAGQILSGPFESYSIDQIETIMRINFYSPIEIIKAIFPILKQNNGGQITIVSSLCGSITFPLFSMYHASRFAVEGFFESLYFEARLFNIKLNLILPGGMKDVEYTTKLEMGSIKHDGYESIIDSVHRGGWYPSFISRKVVAETTANLFISKNDSFRTYVGEECIPLINERFNHFGEDRYLNIMTDRILKKT
jgi:short-subunit dehydrogenase